MTSIRHFPATHPLPDWRNFGVMLRVLLGVNLLALLAALVQAPELAGWVDRYVDLAAVVEPLLLLCLGLLTGLRNLLWRLPLRLGQAVVMALAATLAALVMLYAQAFGLTAGGSSSLRAGLLAAATAGLLLAYFELRARSFSPVQTEARLAALMMLYAQAFGLTAGGSSSLRAGLLAAATAGLLLAYFELRARSFSPVQAEARLAALNARIRPHFLFNALNAVLSLIRARPQQAEEALESLSDLFRAAMRDPASMVSLAEEVDLARQYLELERLRLGERLSVDWQIDPISLQVPIPPLMLQPLLENAVYHGIEPAPAGGTVRVAIVRQGDTLQISVANPTTDPGSHAAGNHIALENIRERLALYYDLESRLEIATGHNQYEVRIILPCQRKRL